jgi:hypothetical protein
MNVLAWSQAAVEKVVLQKSSANTSELLLSADCGLAILRNEMSNIVQLRV